jgi:hypothetical protein
MKREFNLVFQLNYADGFNKRLKLVLMGKPYVHDLLYVETKAHSLIEVCMRHYRPRWSAMRLIFVTVATISSRFSSVNVTVTTCSRLYRIYALLFVFFLQQNSCLNITSVFRRRGSASSGSVVVKALCYKPEGRGFETRWSEPFLRSRTSRIRPWNLLCCPGKETLYLQKLAPTSPTNGGRSVGIVLSRTQIMEFSFF